MTSITLDHISARVNKHFCLNDINLTISPGQSWAVLGPNGSGKTALGRLLCGELAPDSGSASSSETSSFVSFEEVTKVLDLERYRDDSNLCGGADTGTLAREFILADNGGQDELLLDLADRLNFRDILDRGIKFLSTGEMRKAIICRALLKDPGLLVLDEPFDGLDADSKAALAELINDIITGGTRVVLLLNRFREILPEITHVAYLQNGRIILSGPKDTVLGSVPMQRLLSLHNQTPESLPQRVYPGEPHDPNVSPIVMKNIYVAYGEKRILSDLTWEVRSGEHWKIAGPNGSGKTTLLNLISGENTQAYANDIYLFGRKKGSGESVWDIKKRLGIISTAFQRNYRVSGTALSVIVSGLYDTVGLYRGVNTPEKNTALDWLDLMRMADSARQPFHKLSFGEQRLVLLARAMIKHPDVLILDEPCQGLDEINREMVLKVVDILASKGQTQILYVTHQPEDQIHCIRNLLQLVPCEDGGYTGRISRL